MTYKAYAVSWNLTQRCNLFCAHCYISAAPGASAAGELSTDECRRVMADIARVNPGTFLILTGGEPLLRPDIFELAAEGREHGFTVVLGTNGVLLRPKQARLMKTHGVQGASLSLDSVDAARHDEFRHLPGAWRGAIRATEALRAEDIDFSLMWSEKSIPSARSASVARMAPRQAPGRWRNASWRAASTESRESDAPWTPCVFMSRACFGRRSTPLVPRTTVKPCSRPSAASSKMSPGAAARRR